MIILTIRTDRPEAEIGLFDGDDELAYETWEAHRQLSSTIHVKIRKLLESQNKDWQDIKGVVFYIGPGSFTGLRIGATVANTMAATLEVPIAGANGEDWIAAGIRSVKKGKTTKLVVPFYGRDPHITTPKK